jgi:hypothetical protein
LIDRYALLCSAYRPSEAILPVGRDAHAVEWNA